jgi:thioredoxin reductase (NADPH)
MFGTVLTMTNSETHNLIIIGSGPAGLTAAIYAARATLKPLVIEGGGVFPVGNIPGGQLMLTTEVENYPGFPEGINGPELMDAMHKQAERFGAEFIMDEVTKVDLQANPKKVWVGDKELQAKAIIVATGASAIMLGLPAEERLLSHGVSTCATCDGFFFTGKQIAVVGGGDSAMEEALFLTKFATKVTVLVRRDSLRASKIMQDRAKANEKIEFIWNTGVTDLVGEKQLEAIKLKDTVTGTESTMPIEGLFIAIGHKPNSGLFDGQLERDATGYLVRQNGTSKTNIEGVFAAGDIHDHVYRQAVTAAGAGCMAAIDAERWLEHQAHLAKSL